MDFVDVSESAKLERSTDVHLIGLSGFVVLQLENMD